MMDDAAYLGGLTLMEGQVAKAILLNTCSCHFVTDETEREVPDREWH